MTVMQAWDYTAHATRWYFYPACRQAGFNFVSFTDHHIKTTLLEYLLERIVIIRPNHRIAGANVFVKIKRRIVIVIFIVRTLHGQTILCDFNGQWVNINVKDTVCQDFLFLCRCLNAKVLFVPIKQKLISSQQKYSAAAGRINDGDLGDLFRCFTFQKFTRRLGNHVLHNRRWRVRWDAVI